MQAVATPWKDAEVRERVIPQQEALYPRPVVLGCRGCGHVGYWYPGEGDAGAIEVMSARCRYTVEYPGDYGQALSRWVSRPAHDWEVSAWNGHEPVPAPAAARAGA